MCVIFGSDEPVGSKVLQVSAYDVDKGSSLRYSIQSGSHTARDPFNRDVFTTSGFNFVVSRIIQ